MPEHVRGELFHASWKVEVWADVVEVTQHGEFLVVMVVYPVLLLVDVDVWASQMRRGSYLNTS